MLDEQDVPAVDRRLLIEGSVSAKALSMVRAGLPEGWSGTARCLFATYASSDLPLGKRFDFAFPNRDPGAAESTTATVLAVTQQFGKPFDSIPHGWKTICLIDFGNDVPRVIENLPTLDSWGQTSELVALCTRDTMEAIRVSAGPGPSSHGSSSVPHPAIVRNPDEHASCQESVRTVGRAPNGDDFT